MILRVLGSWILLTAKDDDVPGILHTALLQTQKDASQFQVQFEVLAQTTQKSFKTKIRFDLGPRCPLVPNAYMPSEYFRDPFFAGLRSDLSCGR